MNYVILIICSILFPVFSVKVTNPKLCIHCKHFIPDNDIGKFGKCSLFPKKGENAKNNLFLINGIKDSYSTIEENYYFCTTAREFNDMCGEEGKLYKKLENL